MLIISKGKVLLLGLGMQGEAALHDLVRSDEVSEIIVGDRSSDSRELVEGLEADNVRYKNVDASDTENISELMEEVDLVIELLPPGFAFSIAKLAVENGIDMVSTMYLHDPEESDPEKKEEREKELERLDKIAEEKGITILPEFGMDPGLDLILAREAVRSFDEIDELYCYGAGLPVYEAADNPLKYKFTWSVEGLLKTYTRPARIIRDAEVVDISGNRLFFEKNVHQLDLEELGGKLECYPNGDALEYGERLGLDEDMKNFGRYTCRWEGHSDFWRTAEGCGLLDDEPVEVNDEKIAPVEFLASLLKSKDEFWLKEEERDLSMIRVEARGIDDGEEVRKVYKMIDRRDLDSGLTAMQRTVGFTASIGAQMILDGELEERGILSPTEIRLSQLSERLEERGIQVERIVDKIF